MRGLDKRGNSNHRFQFNGKERTEVFNLYWTDFGWRHLDNANTRWWSPDPLAEKYYSISNYAFVANNPIKFVDPDGMRIDVSDILADKDLSLVFKAFFNTKTGRSFIGQFAEEGQTILGHTFESSGKYHENNIDLDITADNLGTGDKKIAPNGDTPYNIEDDRLKINVRINSALNSEGFASNQSALNYEKH